MTGFRLDKLGDTVYLTSSGPSGELGGYRQVVTFTYGFNSSTFIRHTNSSGEVEYVVALEKTLAAPNSEPAVDRIRDHGTLHFEPVISEIMYHPVGDGDEYIELYNPHDEVVDLSAPFFAQSWRFTQGVFYNFDPGTTIEPRSYFLVVPIESDVFRQKYDVPDSTRMFGPYTGELLNTVERLVVSRAAETAAFVPFSMADQVFYNAPNGQWPAQANGQGVSLNRVSWTAYGNDVQSWIAGVATPGRSNQDVNSVGDLTGNGYVDFDDLTLLLAHWDQEVGAARGNLVDPETTPVNFQDLTLLLSKWTGPAPVAAGAPRQVISTGTVASQTRAVRASGHFHDRVRARNARRPIVQKDITQQAERPLRRLQAAAVDRALMEETMSTPRGDRLFARRDRRRI